MFVQRQQNAGLSSYGWQRHGGVAAGDRRVTGWNAQDAHSAMLLSDRQRQAVGSTGDWVSVASLPVTGQIYWEVTDIDTDTYVGVANETVSTADVDNFFAFGFWGYRRSGYLSEAGFINSGFDGGYNYDTYRFWLDVTTGHMWVAINEGTPIKGGDPLAGTTPTVDNISGNSLRVFLCTREQSLKSRVRFSAHEWLYGPARDGQHHSSSFCGIDGSRSYQVGRALPPLSGGRVPLFIFSGQSNMIGGSDQELAANGGANLSAAELGVHPQVQSWSTSSDIWLDYTLGNNGLQVPHGPQIFMVQKVRELLFHQRPVYVVDNALGGHQIRDFAVGGTANATFVDSIRGAVNDLVNQGYEVVPTWFWHQGESDYANVATYQTELTDFIAYVRGLLSGSASGTMPIVMGELWDRPTHNGDYLNITQLNAAIHNVAAADSHAYVCPTKDLPVFDLVHFTSPAQVQFGQMLAGLLRHMPNDCVVTSTI